jgi:hypothetical protein
VHLAGIMNIKTWLLLGISEWRWSDDEHKTYWYNSVELIRTKNEEKLSDLIIIVKEKLHLFSFETLIIYPNHSNYDITDIMYSVHCFQTLLS